MRAWTAALEMKAGFGYRSGTRRKRLVAEMEGKPRSHDALLLLNPLGLATKHFKAYL